MSEKSVHLKDQQYPTFFEKRSRLFDMRYLTPIFTPRFSNKTVFSIGIVSTAGYNERRRIAMKDKDSLLCRTRSVYEGNETRRNTFSSALMQKVSSNLDHFSFSASIWADNIVSSSHIAVVIYILCGEKDMN